MYTYIKYNYLYLTCSFDMLIIYLIRVERNSDEGLFSSLPTYPTEDFFLKEYCLCAKVAGPLMHITINKYSKMRTSSNDLHNVFF